MTKKKKAELLKNYELLFSKYQEVSMAYFNYGMDLSSVIDRERKDKASDDFIKLYVDINRMLEEL